MIDLKDRFTDNQIKKLKIAGISSLYEFITFLPYSYHRILPISNFSRELENVKYITNATLLNFSFTGRGGKFLTLEFEGSYRFRCYFFASAAYIVKSLKKGQNYQLLLSFKNNFWILEKFSALKEELEDSFEMNLGKSKIKEYLDVTYSQRGGINGNYVKSLHKRLQEVDYYLNFKGLVPSDNGVVPEIINLKKIHKPSTVSEFLKTKNDYLAVHVFLKLALVNYVNSKSSQKFGRAATIDKAYLDKMVSLTGFELSESQTEVVQDILYELGEIV